MDIAVWWNFATEYIGKFHCVQIYIEKHATCYRFSNIVLNVSNLAIWFFLVQIFLSILSMYLDGTGTPESLH